MKNKNLIEKLEELAVQANVIEGIRNGYRTELIMQMRKDLGNDDSVVVALAKSLDIDDFYACIWLLFDKCPKGLASARADIIVERAGLEPKWSRRGKEKQVSIAGAV